MAKMCGWNTQKNKKPIAKYTPPSDAPEKALLLSGNTAWGQEILSLLTKQNGPAR